MPIHVALLSDQLFGQHSPDGHATTPSFFCLSGTAHDLCWLTQFPSRVFLHPELQRRASCKCTAAAAAQMVYALVCVLLGCPTGVLQLPGLSTGCSTGCVWLLLGALSSPRHFSNSVWSCVGTHLPQLPTLIRDQGATYTGTHHAAL